jgi:dimethylargininase
MTSKTYGGHTMVAPLHRVLVKRPEQAFGDADPQHWHYTSRPDLPAAQEEHDTFVKILKSANAEVIYHDETQPDHADAIYVHDPVLITDQGAIILQMGKAQRRGEEETLARRLSQLNIPILHRMSGDATAEGGDLMWIDQNTLAVGEGFRTNRQGIEQLSAVLAQQGVSVLPVPLPYFCGPDACLHLMTFISMVADDLAVVYPPLMPVPFFQALQQRGVRFVEVPEEEFNTMGTNVLALAPRDCVMLEDNPVTQVRLEAAGCRVQTYTGNEISLKAEGGPTCLTRPILRQ